jgi:arsenate reductase
MTQRIFNVLFLCTGNSARSIMAEAILNTRGNHKFHAFSAGSKPRGSVRPEALQLLRDNGIPAEGLRSKSWDEFSKPGMPDMDFVFTACDQAAQEACPIWPGKPITGHWGVPDPAAVTGSDGEIKHAFAEAYRLLEFRISLFLSLKLASLDLKTITARVREIGRSEIAAQAEGTPAFSKEDGEAVVDAAGQRIVRTAP